MEERRMGQDKKLDTIISELSDIKTSIAVYASEVAELKKTAKENKEAIKGNGKPGLESRTMLLEKQVGTVNWIGGALLLVVLGDLVTRLMTLVTK